MSAIFGALALGPEPLSPVLAVRMERALAHRPADASGHHARGPVLLGARALWVTPEAQRQVPPYVDPARGVVCVADVRLDRREELAAELGLALDLPDEALIVGSYQRWGRDFAAHLLGDFALALWDPRASRLVLARDAYGLRALYYARTGAALVFGSQARVLFAHRGLTRELDPLRIAQYLARDFGDVERTFFRGVQRLPPGHTLWVEAGELSLRTHFALRPAGEPPAASGRELTARFRELFLDAVRVCLRSHKPVGCLVSGGLDSSGVLGALRDVAPTREIACFAARFPDFPEVDEGPWLAELGGLLPRGCRELRADRLGPLDGVERLYAVLDEPFHAPNLFIYDALAQLARAEGSVVLLDGLDGDSVVDHGYLYLRELARGGRLRSFRRELWALRRRAGFSYTSLIRDFTFGPELAQLHRELQRLGLAHTGYLDRGFARESGFWVEQAARVGRWLEPFSLQQAHFRALSAPIMPFYLEVHDKLAGSLGLEHRHPYFDRRLLEFCLALPPEQRLHDGWDRVIQRRAFTGLIPEPIRARQSKSVWTPNFERQLFARHGERMRSLVDSEHTPLRGYCDLARLRRDLRGPRSSDQVLDLWCAVTLGLWLELPT